jgi:hypothetical protein
MPAKSSAVTEAQALMLNKKAWLTFSGYQSLIELDTNR